MAFCAFLTNVPFLSEHGWGNETNSPSLTKHRWGKETNPPTTSGPVSLGTSVRAILELSQVDQTKQLNNEQS